MNKVGVVVLTLVSFAVAETCDSAFTTDSTTVCVRMWLSGKPLMMTQKNRKGHKHGLQVRFHQNGKRSFVEQFVDGCAVDTTWWFHEEGSLQGYYVLRNCRKDGRRVTFHEGGDTASLCSFHQGKQEGEFKMFYESGKLKQRTQYKNDKRHGPMVFYLEDGTRIDSIIYEQGDIVEEFRYFKNGKLRIKAKYLSKTNKNITHYDPEGNVTGKIRNGKGKGAYWADDDSGGYRSYHVRYEDGRRVYE